MLAQLVTDEAEPGSKEKWCVYSRSLPFPLVNYLTTVIWFNDCSRLRTYTFALFRSKSEVVC